MNPRTGDGGVKRALLLALALAGCTPPSAPRGNETHRAVVLRTACTAWHCYTSVRLETGKVMTAVDQPAPDGDTLTVEIHTELGGQRRWRPAP